MHVEQSRSSTGELTGFILVNNNNKEIIIVTEFLDFTYNRRGAFNTSRTYAYGLKYHFEFLEKHEISYLEAPSVPGIGQAFFNFLSHPSKGLSPTTINNIISATESFYLFLNDRGLFSVVTNPKPYMGNLFAYKGMLSFTKKKNMVSSRYTKAQVPKRLPRPIDKDIVKKMLDAFQTPRDKAIFLLALDAGLRIAEILTLKFSDINSFKGEIFVSLKEDDPHPHNLYIKGRKERIVPLKLSSEFWGYYDQYVLSTPEKGGRPQSKSEYIFLSNQGETKGKPLSYDGIRSVFYYWRRKLGINNPKVTLHAGRHTYATTMLEHGMSIEVLGEILGHASLSSTKLYTQVTQVKVRREYDEVTSRQNND